jgi:hypothetical protein
VDDFESAGFDRGNEAHRTEVERLLKRIALDAHVKLSERGGAIQAFVGQDFWESTEFALGESAAFLDLHRQGVVYISDMITQAAAHFRRMNLTTL